MFTLYLTSTFFLYLMLFFDLMFQDENRRSYRFSPTTHFALIAVCFVWPLIFFFVPIIHDMQRTWEDLDRQRRRERELRNRFNFNPLHNWKEDGF